MSGKATVAIVLSLLAMTLLTQVDAQTHIIPEKAVEFATKLIDGLFRCSAYNHDEFATCWHNNEDARNRYSEKCTKAEVWSYSWWLQGNCYCYKCV